MKILIFVLILFSSGLAFASPAVSAEADSQKVSSKNENSIEKRVELYPLNDTLWVHITYRIMNGYPVPSNGAVVRTTAGLLLLDTPWDDYQTAELIRQCRERFNAEIKFAVITHSHDDRIGGIRTLLKHGVSVISSDLTRRKAIADGNPAPRPFYGNDTLLVFGSMELDVFYPGPGHTADNITVWIPSLGTLYGGCLIKSVSSRDMGNVSEADTKQWPESVSKLLSRYEDIRHVIPGHGPTGGKELLEHTLRLLKEYNSKLSNN